MFCGCVHARKLDIKFNVKITLFASFVQYRHAFVFDNMNGLRGDRCVHVDVDLTIVQGDQLDRSLLQSLTERHGVSIDEIVAFTDVIWSFLLIKFEFNNQLTSLMVKLLISLSREFQTSLLIKALFNFKLELFLDLYDSSSIRVYLTSHILYGFH